MIFGKIFLINYNSSEIESRSPEEESVSMFHYQYSLHPNKAKFSRALAKKVFEVTWVVVYNKNYKLTKCKIYFQFEL